MASSEQQWAALTSNEEEADSNEHQAGSSSNMPQSLVDLCLVRSAKLLLVACRAIEAECGKYVEGECVSRVDKLQDYLLERSGKALNDVCAKAHELLPQREDLMDVRFLFAVELSKYVGAFVFRNEMAFDDVDKDTGFWERRLGRLTGVTSIDIRDLRCTDAMIAAISENCRRLEVFRFATRFRGRTSVTTDGLDRLVGLDFLRVVDDECNLESFSDVFLKKFFRRLLPRLENFSHENLKGFVLDNLPGDRASLPLTDLTIHDARPRVVLATLRLCPKLERLRLGRPYGGIFDDLAESPLDLTGFRIDSFSGDYVAGLCHFLLNKGESLTSLTLDTDAVFSVNEVIVVGECCPNLGHFGLRVQTRRPDNPYSKRPARTEKPIFSRLTSLSLGGAVNANVDGRIAKLFFDDEANVTSLSLTETWIPKFDVYFYHDRPLFPNLSTMEVWIRRGTVFQPVLNTFNLVRLFYRECPKLRFLHLYSEIPVGVFPEPVYDRHLNGGWHMSEVWYFWRALVDEEPIRTDVRLAITGIGAP